MPNIIVFDYSLVDQTLLGERESGNAGQSFVMAASLCAAQKNHSSSIIEGMDSVYPTKMDHYHLYSDPGTFLPLDSVKINDFICATQNNAADVKL